LIRTEDRNITKFDYNSFEDIKPIVRGGFGLVNRAYSKVLKKHVALKYLHNEN
ncbi:1234_t:CDS:1, partial [Diversispora eburnea]